MALLNCAIQSNLYAFIITIITTPTTPHTNTTASTIPLLLLYRLTVGWVWEVVVQDAFEMLGDTEHLQSYQAVLVELTFALTLLLIVLAVHMYVRDWASDAEEDQRTLEANSSSSSSNTTNTGSSNNITTAKSKTHTASSNSNTQGVSRNNTGTGDLSTISV